MSERHGGEVRIESTAKRVRAYLGGVPVADTINAKLVWEVPYFPVYYLPVEDVRADLLTPSDRTERSDRLGEAKYSTLTVGDAVAKDAAWQYPDSPAEALRGLIRLDWNAMDAWFEEDEQVYFSPRNPHHRVDVLHSSRHVRVEVNGTTVAESTHPTLLFETGLPTRYYLPLVDFRMDLLRPSSTTTNCPYKGTANYWSVEAGGEIAEDVVWFYKAPFPESLKVAGQACFYTERVDLYVDGVRQ